MSSSSSITINFQTSCQNAGDILVIESDEEMNQGKTCFLYGEKYYFKIYPFPVNMVLDIIPSDGIIAPEGSGVDTIPITGISGIQDQSPEYVNFTNSDNGKTSKPVTDTDGQSDLFRSNCYWLTQSGNVAAMVNGSETHIVAPEPVISAGDTLTVPQPIIAVYRVQYPSYFKRFSLTLSNRPYNEYPIVIYVMGATP